MLAWCVAAIEFGYNGCGNPIALELSYLAMNDEKLDRVRISIDSGRYRRSAKTGLSALITRELGKETASVELYWLL